MNTTKYEIPADLRPWCEATAPTLTTEDWSRLAAYVAGRGRVGIVLSIGLVGARLARALLAYADEVAAGMTDGDSACLVDIAESERHDGEYGSAHERSVCERLASRGLLWRRVDVDGVAFGLTDWGRYIAGRAAEVARC